MHSKNLMHPAVKLRQIRAFLQIAAEGSLSAVARAQGLTQPALSRTLAELEDLLGVSLFRREGRRLVLTEQGLLFRQHASLGLQALEAGAAALRPDAGGGAIRVGVLPTASTRLFPRVALRFRELAPDTLLSIVTGPHPYLLRLLREGQTDITVGRMPAAGEMAGLTFDHLYEETVVLVARSGHPLAGAPLDVLLRSCPVILPPEDAIIRRIVDEYLVSLGFVGLRAAFETVAQAVGRSIVAGSDALWFISRGVVSDELERGALQTIPTGIRALSGSVGLTRRQAPVQKPGLDLLVQIARETVDFGLHS